VGGPAAALVASPCSPRAKVREGGAVVFFFFGGMVCCGPCKGAGKQQRGEAASHQRGAGEASVWKHFAAMAVAIVLYNVSHYDSKAVIHKEF
jgi:hypothetical protein